MRELYAQSFYECIRCFSIMQCRSLDRCVSCSCCTCRSDDGTRAEADHSWRQLPGRSEEARGEPHAWTHNHLNLFASHHIMAVSHLHALSGHVCRYVCHVIPVTAADLHSRHSRRLHHGCLHCWRMCCYQRFHGTNALIFHRLLLKRHANLT